MPAIPKYPGLQRNRLRAGPRSCGQGSRRRSRTWWFRRPSASATKRLRAFRNVFPDTFYISERGRFFPDDSVDKGRLLSAGYHNVMGYCRDDTPLQELILDEKGKKELDGLWDEFDFIADHTARTYVQYFFNQSGEVLGKGREPAARGRRTKRSPERRSSSVLRRPTWPRPRRPTNDPVASRPSANISTDQRHSAAVERMRAEAEPRQLDALVKFAARAYRRPLYASRARGHPRLLPRACATRTV